MEIYYLVLFAHLRFIFKKINKHISGHLNTVSDKLNKQIMFYNMVFIGLGFLRLLLTCAFYFCPFFKNLRSLNR